MQTIHELIEKLCPNGVEYKNIQELCKISRGKVMSKNFIKANAGEYPVYSSQTENNGELGKISTYDFDGEYLTWTTDGANAGSVFYRKGKFSVTNVCGLLETKSKVMIPKFLYYVLSIEAPKYVNAGMGNPKLMSNVMAKIRVAVPPLEVQCKIVHILDDFTLLSALLSAELKARREQFNYYRSKLFEKYLSDFVELDSIGDVTKLAGFEFTKYVKYSQEGNIIALRGLNVKDGRLVLNDIKYIDNSDFSKLERSKLYKNDLLYTYVGTVGQVGLVDQNNKYYLAPNVARIRINNSKVLPKFVMYFLQTPEFKVNQLDKLTGASSMKNITMTNIRKFKIPLPSIEEQKRIVNILDKFDKYCNNISEGLPAEIEARQKQYEYYRDKLLTFKELKVNE